MEETTSDVPLPIDNTNSSLKHPTPFENIMTLYDQIVKTQKKKRPLIEQLNLLTDSSTFTEQIVNDMDKIEEEIDFLSNYSKTLEQQLVVIMNEHDVRDIPPLPLLSTNPQLK
mgnify:CR=1 FL=1